MVKSISTMGKDIVRELSLENHGNRIGARKITLKKKAWTDHKRPITSRPEIKRNKLGEYAEEAMVLDFVDGAR